MDSAVRGPVCCRACRSTVSKRNATDRFALTTQSRQSTGQPPGGQESERRVAAFGGKSCFETITWKCIPARRRALGLRRVPRMGCGPHT
jgi:hypothetical protein